MTWEDVYGEQEGGQGISAMFAGCLRFVPPLSTL